MTISRHGFSRLFQETRQVAESSRARRLLERSSRRVLECSEAGGRRPAANANRRARSASAQRQNTTPGGPLGPRDVLQESLGVSWASGPSLSPDPLQSQDRDSSHRPAAIEEAG